MYAMSKRWYEVHVSCSHRTKGIGCHVAPVGLGNGTGCFLLRQELSSLGLCGLAYDEVEMDDALGHMNAHSKPSS